MQVCDTVYDVNFSFLNRIFIHEQPNLHIKPKCLN